jgi:hypothetical protein
MQNHCRYPIFSFLALAIPLLLICSPIAHGKGGLQGGSRPAPVAAAQGKRMLYNDANLLGTYYFGEGEGVNCRLTLSRDRKFTFKWNGCLGEYDHNQGTWSIDGDVIVLKPELPNRREGFKGMGVRFIPALWGRRVMLIEENEMPGFCAAATKDQAPTEEYVRGSDYVRLTTTNDNHAKPVVPDRFAVFLRGAIEATVLRVDKQGRAVLDKGSDDGVSRGMLLCQKDYVDGEYGGVDLLVLTVTKHQAIARCIYFFNSNRFVKAGRRYTTGEGGPRPHGSGYRQFDKPPDTMKRKVRH